MHFGAILPNYGRDSSPEKMRSFAEAAEELGFQSLWSTEHVAVGPDAADLYGRVYEPFVTLGWIAGWTDRIELGTSIVIVPLHNPLRLAKESPDREVVFFAIGFETTAPSTALTLKRARAEGVTNFSCMCNHVTIVPPLRALLDSPDLRLDGFIGPGHVSTVVGCRPFEFIPKDYGKPVVVAGFEPLDILHAIRLILGQLADGRCEVENQYGRVVPYDGNPAALKVMSEVFELRPHFEWRGLGFISQSALRLSDDYAELDAERRFSVPGIRVADPKACQCGEVLKGVIKPYECKVFGSACTPEHAIGTCMVSPEGACAAYYNYGRFAREKELV